MTDPSTTPTTDGASVRMSDVEPNQQTALIAESVKRAAYAVLPGDWQVLPDGRAVASVIASAAVAYHDGWHAGQAAAHGFWDVVERALAKARREYVRVAEQQGQDPGPDHECWAEFEALANVVRRLAGRTETP